MIHARFFPNWILAKMDMEKFCELNLSNIDKITQVDLTAHLYNGEKVKWFSMETENDYQSFHGYEFTTVSVDSSVLWKFHPYIKTRVRRT